MKFKYLIIAFGVFIALILLVIVILPSFITGSDLIKNFNNIVIPFVVLIALSAIGLSIFFFSNYRLFSLLEREDWPALAYYLEQKIFVKGRYNNRKVRLLASSYLVISDYNSVTKLESKALLAKPSVVNKNLLIFGAARILSGNYLEAANFFKTHKDKVNEKDAQWAGWFCGFSSLLGGSFNMAEQEFTTLAESSPDPIITGLSAYFLSSTLAKRSVNPENCRKNAEDSRARLVKALKNSGNWKKNSEKMSSDIHIAIIKKYVDEAGKWLFGRI